MLPTSTSFFYAVQAFAAQTKGYCYGSGPGKDKAMAMEELTYTRIGDYLIPNIMLSERDGEYPPLDWYGLMHKEYLRKYQPIRYNTLLLTERLYPACREIDAKAALWLTEIPTLSAAHDIIMAALVCR